MILIKEYTMQSLQIIQSDIAIYSLMEAIPQYVIRYTECQIKNHEGEKINIICLDQQCRQNSLLCSMCALHHKGHQYKPLKIHLDQLYKRYVNNPQSFAIQLEELENRKTLLLHNLQQCVEKISQEIRKIQEDILITYQKIKNQLHQNEVKKNRFEQFYLAMIKNKNEDPLFDIKNYVFTQNISNITDRDIFQNLLKSVQIQIELLRKHFSANIINENKVISIEPIIANDRFLYPKSIVVDGQYLTQTEFNHGAMNMCLFNTPLSGWTSKLRFLIINMPQDSKFTFGIIQKDSFTKANYVFSDNLNCSYIDSTGKLKLVQYSHIGVFGVNTSIDCFIKKNNLKIAGKGGSAVINSPNKTWYFFIAMQGSCKIKFTYPYMK